MIDPTIQSILLIGYAAYEKMHLLPDFVREAAHCLMVCRTAVLGGHTQACPDGHYQGCGTLLNNSVEIGIQN